MCMCVGVLVLERKTGRFFHDENEMKTRVLWLLHQGTCINTYRSAYTFYSYLEPTAPFVQFDVHMQISDALNTLAFEYGPSTG